MHFKWCISSQPVFLVTSSHLSAQADLNKSLGEKKKSVLRSEKKALKQEWTLWSGNKCVCPQLPLSTPPVLSQPPETALMFALRCAELRRPRGLGPGCNPVAGNSVFMWFFQRWNVRLGLTVEMEKLHTTRSRGQGVIWAVALVCCFQSLWNITIRSYWDDGKKKSCYSSRWQRHFPVYKVKFLAELYICIRTFKLLFFFFFAALVSKVMFLLWGAAGGAGTLRRWSSSAFKELQMLLRGKV